MVDISSLRHKADALVTRDGGLHPPSDVIINWPRPNYIDPEEHGWAAPAALVIVLGLTSLVYIARLWARLVVGKDAGLDDLLMSVAMLPLFGLTVSAVLAVRVYGFQWHAWDQTAESFVTSREIMLSMELNYLVSTTLIKISILCFYRRITGSLTNTFVYWVRGSIVLCVGYGILFTLLLIFTCIPVGGTVHIFDFAWRIKNELHCMNEGAMIVACAVISTVQDFVICLLPIFLVWNLRIPRRQKVALCGIFGMGLVTCVCGILRTYYATYVYYYTYDITWYACYGWIWTALEANLGVICASVPALKVFFRRYFVMGTSRAGYSGSGGHRTPIEMSRSRGKATPSQPAYSAGASHVEPESVRDAGVPFDGIKVSQGLDISVDQRDDLSQRSFASTKNLTALPMSRGQGWRGSQVWIQGCRTVCAALKPGQRSKSRSRSHSKDIERGASSG